MQQISGSQEESSTHLQCIWILKYWLRWRLVWSSAAMPQLFCHGHRSCVPSNCDNTRAHFCVVTRTVFEANINREMFMSVITYVYKRLYEVRCRRCRRRCCCFVIINLISVMKTSQFTTQCKGDVSHAFKTAKIIVFDCMMCKSPDVPLQAELLAFHIGGTATEFVEKWPLRN